MVRSFGHFSSGFIESVFSIATDSASADAIGNSVVMVISNVGLSMTDSHMPPLSETHLLADLPCPLVCSDAIITAPSFVISQAISSALF